jgi:hypothetical protein
MCKAPGVTIRLSDTHKLIWLLVLSLFTYYLYSMFTGEMGSYHKLLLKLDGQKF